MSLEASTEADTSRTRNEKKHNATMYYQGQLRQLGGGRKLGLGDIFHAFTRVIIPNMYQMYKNRNDKSYWRGKAMTQGPKILQKAVKLGVGVVSDAVSKKKTVKQSLKD